MNASALVIGLVFIALWVWCGIAVGKRRGRPVLGAVLCAALGLIGLGIFMLIPRTPEARARRDRERAAGQQPEQPEPAGLRPPLTGPDAP